MTDPSRPDPVRRFSDRVGDYVRHRPRYPEGVLDLLRAVSGLAPGWVVADLGSGTGLSAEPFLAAGHLVHAVEPNPDMRAAAVAILGHLPNFRPVAGTAEATTLSDRSVDLVVAGQAFHWFDPAAAGREARRVLRPGGWAALVWNTRRTDSTPMLRELEGLLLKFGTDYSAVRHDAMSDEALSVFFGGPFVRHVLPNEQRLDRAGLVGRVLSCSYVPAPGQENHDEMVRSLGDVFDRHQEAGRVRIEYDTELFVGRPG